MSNALVPIADMERMALAFSKSGMFGAKTQDQALSLLLLAQAEGQHPAIAMRDFDVIQGRPAKKAEAMLRSFLAAGGSVEWHTLTDELADATFSHPQGGKARISWDVARTKKAGLGGKEMYSKYPRQMLRSRTVSEGCRTVYPAATSGMYVPEEVRQMLKEDKRQEKDMGPAEQLPPEITDEDVITQIPERTNSDTISADQAIALEDALREGKRSKDKLLANVSKQYGAKVERLAQIKTADYADAMKYARGE